MQLLILSDSVALPRHFPEDVDLHSTWPYLLREALHFEFIQTSIGGATSDELLKQTFYYNTIEAKVVLIQCGIVDLAPRAFRPYELELLNRFKITRSILHKIRNNKSRLNSIRNFRKVTYVSLRKFEKNLIAFKNIFGDSLYWINIPSCLAEYEKVVPGIISNIKKYNESIKRVLGENVIDISTFSNNEMMSDFHHLNQIGHSKAANKILEKLRQNHVIQ